MNTVIVSILTRTIAAGTPLLLGTLGEIVAERSGILNLGVEGMMSMGAVGAFMVAMNTGSPWAGLAAAIIAGAALSLLHAFSTITLKVNQTVSGLALSMLGVGMSGLLGKPYMGRPLQAQMPDVPIPGLSEIPYVGKILFDQDPLFYFAVVLGIVLWFLLAKTRWGLRVRSVGENPAASAVQGISVPGLRYMCTAIGGALAGHGRRVPVAGLHQVVDRRHERRQGLDRDRAHHLRPVESPARVSRSVPVRRDLRASVHPAAAGHPAQPPGRNAVCRDPARADGRGAAQGAQALERAGRAGRAVHEGREVAVAPLAAPAASSWCRQMSMASQG